ncbi:hypothetical protein E1262_13030 [Jiangella aurantiaca]|uniref:DUF3558 domain-containing protein n=1 Tax=Jiangella aurantiaca TaxID=2530373 RepID=A0A4R5AC17_9ACTN|nr:hypothetical protein [Jiangella aurantiaca]TDD69245.1 hypothetical protein E1262_13030 [Jiangella aurantiaca]
MRLLKTAAVLVAAVLAVAGCGDDDEGDTPVDTSTIPATAPGGELLCDFLPAESAALALGGEVSAEGGQVTRDTQGVLTSAGCRVTVDGGSDVALSVLVDYMMGSARTGFEDGLADAETYHQLPDDRGLGYTFTDGDTAQARLSRGDYLVEVRIAAPAESRDGEADAAAIAQQVGQTLEIPEEWTLQGTPPSR